ncbi:peptidyl-prolyl cis-trans isomerase CYP38, chloroplastic [Selaginella moellendorffii]|uniref:peptidyl-prolyl cis-trans isomerase CYP38, chloroplastic n=1 Tax=Selaginella moellendorffii TaxID=88036 RepID=UPI000D1C743A|nr:peptidyl-prolyl cis-trans isomerase CYP38, chloroplastic [Selaginella moellendorffii]|eukprot:XP_024533837.1 peptidyl-prolyl cis-trans isomerase CYP38, chloroplastic [Selaginella moellendorffii]
MAMCVWRPLRLEYCASSSSSSSSFKLQRLDPAGCADGSQQLRAVPRKKCRLSMQCRAQCGPGEGDGDGLLMKAFQKYAVCVALAATFALPLRPQEVHAFVRGPAVSDVAALISGPPIKDPSALLRYGLPIDNKPIREVQRSLEDITENLKVPGPRALDSVGKNVRQAARVLSQSKEKILADVAEAKKSHAEGLLSSLVTGLQDFQTVTDKESVAPKQTELLNIVGNVEEDMVAQFPFEVPEEYASRPLLKGRATVEMKVNVKDNPNVQSVVFRIVADGYNAPVTAGNFLDLVERHFYDGMEIQRADGFVVQTGDPAGPAEGFVDPGTGKVRTIPLEIMVDGDKAPIYGATLEELGRYKAKTKLPFNAFGTLAMARDEFENDSASSQIFWLLKESELTPSNANILDGRYSVFGYVVQNQEYLADLKVGDTIESMRVTSGIENLVNPSYKAL